MSVLSELSIVGNNAQVGVVKKALAWAFWTQWYPAHMDDVVAKIWIVKTVRVRDVRFVFVLVFGPPPNVS